MARERKRDILGHVVPTGPEAEHVSESGWVHHRFLRDRLPAEHRPRLHHRPAWLSRPLTKFPMEAGDELRGIGVKCEGQR